MQLQGRSRHNQCRVGEYAVPKFETAHGLVKLGCITYIAERSAKFGYLTALFVTAPGDLCLGDMTIQSVSNIVMPQDCILCPLGW